MLQQVWAGENRRITVCVDSYEDGIMKGRFYNAWQEMEHFESLVQFLSSVEKILENQQTPQSYTSLRRFSELLPEEQSAMSLGRIRKGTRATFEVLVLFRQHSSWQGMVIWREQKQEQPFRSVLELIMLLDSALRTQDSDVA